MYFFNLNFFIVAVWGYVVASTKVLTLYPPSLHSWDTFTYVPHLYCIHPPTLFPTFFLLVLYAKEKETLLHPTKPCSQSPETSLNWTSQHNTVLAQATPPSMTSTPGHNFPDPTSKMVAYVTSLIFLLPFFISI
jgi:hypothetical protein